MDIRSSEGQFISGCFDRSYMQIVANRLTNTATNQVFARTTSDRLVRIDVEVDQLNVLEGSRQRFMLVRALAPGETILTGPGVAPITRAELLPPLSFLQAASTHLPWAATHRSRFAADAWPRPTGRPDQVEGVFEPQGSRPSDRFGAGLFRSLGFEVPVGGWIDIMLRDTRNSLIFAIIVGIPLIILGFTILQFAVIQFLFFLVYDHLSDEFAAN